MDDIPEWIQSMQSLTTKKSMEDVLKQKGFKHSFKTKKELSEFVSYLQWPYNMSWREEQNQVIHSFFRDKKEVIVQAIFGGGKTTMMLAILHILLIHDRSLIDKVFLCAFNIGIKNELKKKTRPLGKLLISTFDSFIYKCCEILEYDLLKELNFETKRRFVRENLSKLPTRDTVQYVFVDESQDLETQCYKILKHVFPRARFLFVGDVFQSIQKEPKESMLWYLLNRRATPEVRVFRMVDTPRVPMPILNEIRSALVHYYPEFASIIEQWKSSSGETKTKKVRWIAFDQYRQVYGNVLEQLKDLDPAKTMILTFSSAITVRGSLGDVARFRRFLVRSGYSINPNHKRMLDDRLFLSTANSSKGLERDHVICVLTFPLELAFSNFSNDLVMNIITVAMSRCKKDITFYVPNYTERFSEVLKCFDRCPLPSVTSKPTTHTHHSLKETNTFEYNPHDPFVMLGKEHSATEVLRQSILSYETRALLLRYVSHSSEINLPPLEKTIPIRTEEECALTGLIFECLILSLWTGRFPVNHFIDIQHHNMFSGHVQQISQKIKMYHAFIRKYKMIPNEVVRFQGSFLYAQLHLFAHQKIWIDADKTKNKIMFERWKHILPIMRQIPVKKTQIKTQVNSSMPFLKGIMDACYMPAHHTSDEKEDTTKECLIIYEIKASKSSDWKQNALLQSVLYALMNGKSWFQVCLVNVFAKKAKTYTFHLKKDLRWLRAQVLQDILNWNMNCFLAKNQSVPPKIPDLCISMQQTLFIDGDYDILEKTWHTFSVCLFTSPTKTRLCVFTEKNATPVDHSCLSAVSLLKEFLARHRQIYGEGQMFTSPFMHEHGFGIPSMTFQELPFFPPDTTGDSNHRWKVFVSQGSCPEPEDHPFSWSDCTHRLTYYLCQIIQNQKIVFIDP